MHVGLMKIPFTPLFFFSFVLQPRRLFFLLFFFFSGQITVATLGGFTTDAEDTADEDYGKSMRIGDR